MYWRIRIHISRHHVAINARTVFFFIRQDVCRVHASGNAGKLLIRRFNYTAVILIGSMALLARHLFYSLSDSPWILSLSYVLAGMVIVFYSMGVSMLVNVMAGPEVRATAQTGLVLISSGLGPMFANWMAGRLASQHGNSLRPVFLFAAVLAGVAAVLIAARGRRLTEKQDA